MFDVTTIIENRRSKKVFRIQQTGTNAFTAQEITLVGYAVNHTTYINDGVLTNHLGRVEMLDVVRDYGLDVIPGYDAAKQTVAYDAYLSKVIAAYKAARANCAPSAEELFEMRAAFGAGVAVVDAISGRKVRL